MRLLLLLSGLCLSGLCLPAALIKEAQGEAQQSIAAKLGEKVQRFEMRIDEEGNVTGLFLINHQAFAKSVGERPGITDADLLKFRQFPKLTAVNFEAQPIGDAGLQILREFPQLRQVGFHYMAKAEGAHATPDFIKVIDGLGDLEIIEIKHNFRMKAINVEQLQRSFPKAWRLVLDTPLTATQTMHMIRLCPNVTDLQLHRTDVSADQLAEIGRLLPKLEVLWLKPRQGVQAEQLAALRAFEHLRIFSPQSFKEAVPFADGWDALSAIPSLERLELAESARKQNAAALEQLLQQRPKLHIDSRLTRSRNYKGL
ncbi:MAG: hypothetical protein AAF670_10620 [Planctomycetota bacterium]